MGEGKENEDKEAGSGVTKNGEIPLTLVLSLLSADIVLTQ